MERIAYVFGGKLYHPECLPENKDANIPGGIQVTPIFSLEQVEGEKKCSKCKRRIKSKS